MTDQRTRAPRGAAPKPKRGAAPKPKGPAAGTPRPPKKPRNRRRPKDAAPAEPRKPAPPAPVHEGFVEIGYVEKAHGLEGEVRVVPHNVDTVAVASGRTLHLGVGAGTRPSSARGEGSAALAARRIRSTRVVPGGYLVRFEGVDGRDAADALRGLAVFVDRASLPPPEEGAVYASDLVGARVELTSGNVIGTIERVVEYPSVAALAVRLDDGRTIEVPMVDAYIAEIDAESHLVKVHHVDEL